MALPNPNDQRPKLALRAMAGGRTPVGYASHAAGRVDGGLQNE